MKKLKLFIVSVLLLIPFTVNAAEPKVTSLDAKVSSGTISYNGTMEDGSHAVMCKLYDSNSKEIDLLSSAVDSNKFEGSFTVSSKGTYKVSCANYEGGEITEKTVEVIKVKNPKTGDKIVLYLVVGIISLVGVGCLTLRFKKQMK